jgi:LysM repeat protein
MRRSLKIAALFVVLLMCVFLAVSTTNAQQPASTEQAVAPPPATSTPLAPTPGAPAKSQATAVPSTPASGTSVTYTVQPGDNLFRIALRFGMTTQALAQANGIVNPSLIFVGQVLKIPGKQGGATPPATTAPTAVPTKAPTATPTTAAAGTTTYTVAPGETLFKIAIRFKTTVAKLQQLNNLPNPNLIFVGQKLTVPAEGSAAPPTSAPAATQISGGTPANVTVANPGFDFGVEAYMVGQDTGALAQQITQLGMTWAKVDVYWRDLEPTQGQINFTPLDPVVEALNRSGLKIMFTVSTSPKWARTSVDEDGPPDDYATFATFVGALAQRYAGKVAAYEIWDEPNLRREWNSKAHKLGAGEYIQLLSKGDAAIKAADATAKVITAGLAPTGFNDGVNAVDDRVFLQDLYSNKVASFSDAIGAHPGGWANPPDSRCCKQSPGVKTHFDHPSFYFLDTLNDYRQIMIRNNAGGTPIWVTKFGWGSSEDAPPPGQNNIFLTYTSLAQQAQYDPRGFELGAQLGFVGPMFLSALNGCQAQSSNAESCYYSLIGSNGTARPVFSAVQNADKSKATTKLSAPTTTTTTTTTETQPTVEVPPTSEPTLEQPPVAATPEATP